MRRKLVDWCTLDLMQAYRQVPLREDAQGMFPMTTPEVIFTPRCVPLGVLNSTEQYRILPGDDGLCFGGV